MLPKTFSKEERFKNAPLLAITGENGGFVALFGV